MANWFLGEAGLPDAIARLQPEIESAHGAPGELSGFQSSGSGSPVVVLSVHDVAGSTAALRWLNTLPVDANVNVVVIVSDGYLGAEVIDRSLAANGAAAVSAVRSLAASRGGSVRANVICIPEALIGGAGVHRGPLAHQPGPEDVVDALLFFMNEENSYLSGQVLFVDGGRQLFSSHTS